MIFRFEVLAYHKRGALLGSADSEQDIFDEESFLKSTFNSYLLFKEAGADYFGLKINGIEVMNYKYNVLTNTIVRFEPKMEDKK